MRNWMQVLGVFMLLVAMPAWASSPDLRLGPMFLSPVFFGSFVACLVGLFVRSVGAARLWTVLLVLGAFPAVGLLVLFALFKPDHVHEGEMDLDMVLMLAILALVASYAWAFWRIVVSLKPPQGTTPTGSQPT